MSPISQEWIARLTDDLRTAIQQETVQFYVGSESSFDRAIHRILEELYRQSGHVYFAVVLPGAANLKPLPPHADALIPAGVERVPPRLRAIKRDEWMIRRSKMVIACDENNLILFLF